jgi:hypothetical protein
MKSVIIMIFLSLLIKTSRANGVTVELKISYFNPSEQAFKDIYGSGLMYDREVNIRVLKNLQLWLEGGFFSKKGKMTFAQEETKLELLPLGTGAKYSLTKWKISFYLGMGLNYYRYKEETPLRLIRKGALGYLGKIGGVVKIGDGLVMNFYTDYSDCKTQPADYKVNIGGLRAGVGLGYRF